MRNLLETRGPITSHSRSVWLQTRGVLAFFGVPFTKLLPLRFASGESGVSISRVFRSSKSFLFMNFFVRLDCCAVWFSVRIFSKSLQGEFTVVGYISLCICFFSDKVANWFAWNMPVRPFKGLLGVIGCTTSFSRFMTMPKSEGNLYVPGPGVSKINQRLSHVYFAQRSRGGHLRVRGTKAPGPRVFCIISWWGVNATILFALRVLCLLKTYLHGSTLSVSLGWYVLWCGIVIECLNSTGNRPL